MNYDKFPFYKPTKHALACRNPKFGFGINDADYLTNPIVNGKKITCPIYSKWSDIFRRVYSPKLHAKRPSYIGTSVCEEWHLFSNFRKWAIQQDNWATYDLDKDILYPNNKEYSPDKCLFVPPYINALFTGSPNNRDLPLGVSIRKNTKTNKYVSQIKKDNKVHHIGHYNNVNDAEISYLEAKMEYIKTLFDDLDEKIVSGLNRHIQIMEAKVAILSNK